MPGKVKSQAQNLKTAAEREPQGRVGVGFLRQVLQEIDASCWLEAPALRGLEVLSPGAQIKGLAVLALRRNPCPAVSEQLVAPSILG